jgi:hypothetical protein
MRRRADLVESGRGEPNALSLPLFGLATDPLRCTCPGWGPDPGALRLQRIDDVHITASRSRDKTTRQNWATAQNGLTTASTTIASINTVGTSLAIR